MSALNECKVKYRKQMKLVIKKSDYRAFFTDDIPSTEAESRMNEEMATHQ
jgi:hypothetical protein